MGYDCSFNAIRRYKDISFEDMQNILNYLEWRKNPWNFEDDHYPTYEKYWNAFVKSFYDSEEVFPGEPKDKTAIHFYEQYLNTNHTINYWCSIGYECLDEYMTRNLTEVGHTEDWIGIDNDFIKSSYQWACERLNEYELVDLYPINSIKKIENDEDSVILTKIDGVEMKDDNDKVYRIYDNEYCDSSVHYCSNDERRTCYEGFIQTLDFIKFLYDQGDYFIWFSRSY